MWYNIYCKAHKRGLLFFWAKKTSKNIISEIYQLLKYILLSHYNLQ